ncbi:MAG TPA: EpsI family protein [Candidatus Dormibacteraeota bacterium]|nr:EpsI family protein [Candidatus Dormibacteraeota bacterium]
MHNASPDRSLWCAAALMLAGILAMHQLHRPEITPPSVPLTRFPHRIESWSGTDVPLTQNVIQAAGLNEYVNRIYHATSRPPVTLFISYYRTQRTGQTIHSPKNCLPGAGWQPIYSRQLSIPLAGTKPIVVNEYDIVRDTNRVLVLYWYQERGREIASEYAAKFWLSFDALTRNRTDGALVRVTTPVRGGRGRAEQRAVGFVRAIFPHLGRFIPN